MSLRDVLTGRSKVKGPAPDRLFAISTAYVTLESEYGIEPQGVAAIVFQALATAEFDAALRDTEQIVRSTCADSGTEVQTREDDYGYRWMILRPGGVEELAVGINGVSSALENAGHGERLLCAVFAFRDTRHNEDTYFIYNYKRGCWYPFVPAPGGQIGERNTERELQLKAQLASDLPLEPELERWFPLWGIPI